MCEGCYEAYGRPKRITPAVLEAAPLLREADEFGALHIVVSDWNLEDEHIDFCGKQASITSAEQHLLDILKVMSFAERVTALALAEGYLTLGAVADA